MSGGICYIAKRHSKANKKYMKYYDSSKESKYITYLDANLLYGWAMSQYLPYTGFKWVIQKEISEISQNVLSKYCCNITDKLMPNLGNKSKYVLHYRNLQLYLSLGMKLTKIRRILKFKQSDWLKKYIDFNTDKRKNSGNSFEKDFFKFMNNAVFGKTVENLRTRTNFKLINNAKGYVRCISKASFFPQKIFSKYFVAIHEIKPVLTLNKPIYVGFSILD